MGEAKRRGLLGNKNTLLFEATYIPILTLAWMGGDAYATRSVIEIFHVERAIIAAKHDGPLCLTCPKELTPADCLNGIYVKIGDIGRERIFPKDRRASLICSDCGDAPGWDVKMKAAIQDFFPGMAIVPLAPSFDSVN